MTPALRLFAAAAALAFITGACGGGSTAHDGGGGGSSDGGAGGATGAGGAPGGRGGGSGGSGGTTGVGGSTGTGGGPACGGATCGTAQVCVHPTCGGGVAVCVPLGDAGQCPQGWAHTDQCSSGSGPGCIPPPCDPPPPKCVDVPAACAGAPTCGCLPANICEQPNGGSCGLVNGQQVTCVSFG